KAARISRPKGGYSNKAIVLRVPIGEAVAPNGLRRLVRCENNAVVAQYEPAVVGRVNVLDVLRLGIVLWQTRHTRDKSHLYSPLFEGMIYRFNFAFEPFQLELERPDFA